MLGWIAVYIIYWVLETGFHKETGSKPLLMWVQIHRGFMKQKVKVAMWNNSSQNSQQWNAVLSVEK